MRKYLVIAILFIVCSANAQVNNIVANPGLTQTSGPPTFIPGPRGSVAAIDTITGLWWVNPNRLRADTWFLMGHTMRKISGCSAPSGAPTKFQSWLVTNNCTTPQEYLWDGSAWDCLNCGSSGGTVTTDATLDGDGSGGDPLKIAQQSAATSQVLEWTGTTWEPSWGNPYTFVTTTGSITADYNTVLIGDIVANITIGLPSCNAAHDSKIFEIRKNETTPSGFGVTIDPSGSETFYDGAATKTIYTTNSITCVCRFAGTGKWFFTF